MYITEQGKATTYQSAELDGKKIMAAFLSVRLAVRLAAMSYNEGAGKPVSRSVVLDIRLFAVNPPCPPTKSVGTPSLHFPATVLIRRSKCPTCCRALAYAPGPVEDWKRVSISSHSGMFRTHRIFHSPGC